MYSYPDLLNLDIWGCWIQEFLSLLKFDNKYTKVPHRLDLFCLNFTITL